MNDTSIFNSLDGEQGTLGAMLMEPDAVSEAMDILSGVEFYREMHRKTWDVIVKLYNAGTDIDLITVGEELRIHGELDSVGGFSYLTALIEACPSAANVAAYAQPVKDTYLLRCVVKAGEDMIRDVKSQEFGVDDILARCEKRVMDISRDQTQAKASTLSELVERQVERVIHAAENPGDRTGVETGFVDLDRQINRFKPGELIVVAGNTGMGKSTLASGIATHVCKATRLPVFVFTMEMNEDMWLDRMVCAEAGINGQDLANGLLSTQQQWEDLKTAQALFAELPMIVVDTPGMTTASIRAQSRRLAAIHGTPALVVIDYLQIANIAEKCENERIRVTRMIVDLKNLARQIEAPVVCLSQITREAEKRDDKRPRNSDLRETGAIEAESDVVLFVHRPSYYKRKMAAELGKEYNEPDEPDEIIIGKQRSGPAGIIIPVRFASEYARFENYTQENQ